MSWIASVVRDLQTFCTKNDLQETAKTLSKVPDVLEREIAEAKPTAKFRRVVPNVPEQR